MFGVEYLSLEFVDVFGGKLFILGIGYFWLVEFIIGGVRLSFVVIIIVYGFIYGWIIFGMMILRGR